uniref:ABC transporter domain-containing protein n=1 Tax=Cucumis melo TaxID=3656 RepID=A0A9I9CWU5_CUCME
MHRDGNSSTNLVSSITRLFIIGLMTMTVFLRTRMEIDIEDGNYFMGALFFALILLLVDGFPELVMTIQRLEVFYKQKQLYFYPAWAYAIPAAILKIPLSLLESIVWTSLTYYVIGFAPQPVRFFQQFFILFGVHLSALSMFRLISSIFQSHGASITVQATNTTIGHEVLKSRGLDYHKSLYWISVAALFGLAFIFNIGFVLALTFLNPPGSSRAIISYEKLSQSKNNEECDGGATSMEQGPFKTVVESKKGRIALPFRPLTVVFQDLQYYVDMPLFCEICLSRSPLPVGKGARENLGSERARVLEPEMKERGFTQKKLQLLSDITGALRPGVLTALMGVSGAGKTTLLDVLAGRKTSGYIEGEIKIGGFPKVQETFARISGYCEQTDIHSPRITVEESLIFSAWLRLAPDINSKTKAQFVNEVIETIELDGIKDMLVGIPGVNGLSTEQRKRLTIAVELVSNPSIIFMDEPTTGLDARAAAIVMRAVKNVVDTGRTIVCTIHQPSIDIFESFDELILLKTGGRMIYCGPLGQCSRKVIEYFEHVPGVSKIRENYNPGTWMLEVTSPSAEDELGIDFAQEHQRPCKAVEQSTSRENQQNLFNVFGSMYTAVIFLGIDNCSSVLPNVSTERTVMYRERFAGMYSSWAYSLAQVIVEVPYLFIQAAAYVIIVYPMIGYYGSATKILWCFYSFLCAFLCYNYLGMLLVSITPNFHIANILSSAFYTVFNLFSGFLVPNPRIPKWWTWMYYITPTSWTLNCLLTSQYGDIDKTLTVFGEKTTVSAFLRDYFGFQHSQLPLVAVILILFPLFALKQDDTRKESCDQDEVGIFDVQRNMMAN